MTTRDQQRAQRAYAAVRDVPPGDREDFKIAVHALGAEILQSGLAAAMAGLERRTKENQPPHRLFGFLGQAQIPGIGKAQPGQVANIVRGLPLDAYILATRETLQAVLWLKRAVQAKFES